jgi:hypothetical protein
MENTKAPSMAFLLNSKNTHIFKREIIHAKSIGKSLGKLKNYIKKDFKMSEIFKRSLSRYFLFHVFSCGEYLKDGKSHPMDCGNVPYFISPA